MGRGANRYMQILDLFTETNSIWTVADLSQKLDTASSTVYRHVRELVGIGFLASSVDAQYRLGPKFTEFDRRLRKTDPLILAGAGFLDKVLHHVGPKCSVLLCQVYGQKVMCVADLHGAQMPLRTSFERGLPMPLVRSATARAALSTVEPRRLMRLLQSETEFDAPARTAFRARLSRIHKDGFCIAEGEVDAGAVGIAVPVRHRGLGVEASLSIVARSDQMTRGDRDDAVALLRAVAGQIEGDLARRYALTRPGPG